LRDEWESRFLRKKAEEGVTSITVRRVRAWMDQPEAMGCAQTCKPRDPELRLAKRSRLLSAAAGGASSNVWMMTWSCASKRCRAAHWQDASKRAATILGYDFTLLNAANVAKAGSGCKGRAERERPRVERLTGVSASV
jgi:hypothetical protein